MTKDKIEIKSYWVLLITSIASLLTSIGVIVSVPNKVVDYIDSIYWERDFKVHTLSSNDFTLFYNGNPSDIFVNRIEFMSDDLGLYKSMELNLNIPGHSFVKYAPEKESQVNAKGFFEGSLCVLKFLFDRNNGKLPAEFQVIFLNEEHYMLKGFHQKVSFKPTVFNSEVKIHLFVKGKMNTIIPKSKAIIATTLSKEEIYSKYKPGCGAQ